MKRQHIVMMIAIGVVCLAAGYWIAMPADKALAPGNASSVSVISINDASSSQIYKISGEYPQFAAGSAAFNAAIATYVESNLSQFESNANANWQARIATMPTGTKNTLPPQSFTFDSSWSPEQINNRYISVIVRLEYFDGGANETELLQTFNYDVAAKRVMTLADLFPGVPTYLQQISSLAIQELTSTENANSDGNAATDMIQSGAGPSVSNYANFTFNDSVVNIYFPKYQVAPGSFGEQSVIIVRSTIQ